MFKHWERFNERIMSEQPEPLKRSVGVPFWAGCFIGPIVFLVILWTLGVFHDSFSFWFFVCVAFVVFGPVGGVLLQAIHDLFTARRLRLLSIWDYTIFTAIGVALLIAGFVLFRTSGKNSDIDVFKNRTFDIAGALVVLLVMIYALRDSISTFSARQLSHAEAMSVLPPPHIRAFAAGAFTFIFFQGVVQGLCEFVSSVVAGKPTWPLLAGSIVFGGVGIALGLSLLAGSSRALRWVRLLLLLAVAGGGIGFVLSVLHIWSPQNGKVMADVIISLALLILLSRKRQPSVQE